jgi:hypothetical protein
LSMRWEEHCDSCGQSQDKKTSAPTWKYIKNHKNLHQFTQFQDQIEVIFPKYKDC